MILLYYLLCFATGIVTATLDAHPWNSWQWWAFMVIVIGSNFAGYCAGKKHKEENKNA